MIIRSWLIEKNIFEEEFVDELKKELDNQDMSWSEIEYVPFEGRTYTVDPDFLFYGSLECAAHLMKTTDCTIFYKQGLYDCTGYYPLVGPWLLNKNYTMLPYGELVRRKQHLLEQFGSGEYNCVFIRPNSGAKIFTGMLMCKDTFEQDMEFIERYSDIPSDTLVIVAPAQNIKREHRFVVANNKIITGSTYKVGTNNETKRLHSHDIQWSIAQAHVDGIELEGDPLWVMDIAETIEGFSILEIGCFSCAGLYDCDPAPIVKAVKELA